MKKALLLYVPALHDGYFKLLKKYVGKVDALYLLGREITSRFTYLEREIRAPDPQMVMKALQSLFPFKKIEILRTQNLRELAQYHTAIMPNEALMRRFANKYLDGMKKVYDISFLRWDEHHVHSQKPVKYDRISRSPFDRKMMDLARKEGTLSSDWWRRVGAVIVKENKIVLQDHNQHLPNEYQPYVLGDIRDYIKSGEKSDIGALHAERAVIAQAARMRSISLEGTSIYVSVFPCSSCAQMIAYSGIRNCFFGSGHANFNGEAVMKAHGMAIIYVK